MITNRISKFLKIPILGEIPGSIIGLVSGPDGELPYLVRLTLSGSCVCVFSEGVYAYSDDGVGGR